MLLRWVRFGDLAHVSISRHSSFMLQMSIWAQSRNLLHIERMTALNGKIIQSMTAEWAVIISPRNIIIYTGFNVIAFCP